MIEKKKPDIVDDFISKVRSHPAMQMGLRPRRIDDLEAVLNALFVSDNEHAVEMFDEIASMLLWRSA